MNLVENKLIQLHNDAKNDYKRMGTGLVKSIFRPIQPADFKHAYLPISKDQGNTLRDLIVENNCKHVVEFGTSFGVSTIYLADGVRQTCGKVTTTELIKSKAEKAKLNIKEAGLEDFVDIKIGDAMETLKNDVTPIDLLFLDGWKDLYLPLFKMLEPRFHSATIIYADNINMADARDYVDYMLSKSDLYSTQSADAGKAFLSKAS